MGKKKWRKTVALFLDRIEMYYQKNFWAGIGEYLEKKGIRLFVVAGGPIESSDYDLLFNCRIYSLLNIPIIDGIIIVAGALGHFSEKERIQKFCSSFSDKKVISLGLLIENIVSVAGDNETGISDLISHLIEAHGCKRIAFVQGPKSHPDAIARFSSYQETLQRYGIQLDEELIVRNGTFFPEFGSRAVDILFRQRKVECDAVMASNDEVAIQIMYELNQYGYLVPDDVIVTGFDNILGSQFSFPSLTTVSQNISYQAELAAQQMYSLLEDEDVQEWIQLPSRPVIRQTCGCFKPEIQHASVSSLYISMNSSIAIEEKRSQLKARLHRIMQIRAEDTESKNRIDKFVITGVFGAEDEYQNNFLNLLDSILRLWAVKGYDVTKWQEGLSECRKTILSCGCIEHDRDVIENCLHEARVLISLASERKYSWQIESSERVKKKARSIGNSIISAFALKDIYQILSERLREINITECFIALTNKDLDTKGKALLSFVLSDSGEYTHLAGREFQVSDLLPGEILGAIPAYSLVILPLSVKQDVLGYMVVNADPEMGEVLEYFRGILSNAVKAALLVEEVEEQKMTLEEKVKLRTKELFESEQKYRTYFRESITGNFILDQRGVIQTCNKAFAKIFGFENANYVQGKKIGDLISTAQLEEMKQLFYAQGRLDYYEAELIREDGAKISIIVSIVGEPGTVHSYSQIRGYVFDITPRKNLEDMLRQSQKMEALGRLAGGVAHDFNNLLTAINGYSELLRDTLEEESDLHEDVLEIIKAGKRAAALTNQLLAFSRRQVVTSQQLNLNTVILELQKMLRRLLREDIKLITDLKPQIGVIEADRSQLEQVIMNLVLNARDAMPEGGELRVMTKMEHLEETRYKKEFFMLPGSYVALTISDTGIGMDEETVRRIFDPFFTTKEQGAGTGLGLATVYGIVKQSSGQLEVNSVPGAGTSFVIHFPVTGVNDAETAGHQVTELSGAHGTENILVIEDEKQVRKFISRLLTYKGYTVTVKNDGESGIKTLKKAKKSFDLIITDIIMPGMTGFQTVRKIREELKDRTPVLFMSGYTEENIRRNQMLYKEGSFIAKPFTSEKLIRMVRDILDSAEKS
ncbi:MAG: ATP-binding protein [Spirochaetia bacterium]